ncbi:MAG: hypothetical protein Q8P82_00455 [bacterium]|nr:hypothetical protein [bacterium]
MVEQDSLVSKQFSEQDIESNKWFSALAYLWILFLIPLLARPKSPFAQAHAKQGMVLFAVQIISSLVVWVPIIGPVWNVVIVFFIPIMALARTLAGRYWAIPIIDNYARKISFE